MEFSSRRRRFRVPPGASGRRFAELRSLKSREIPISLDVAKTLPAGSSRVLLFECLCDLRLCGSSPARLSDRKLATILFALRRCHEARAAHVERDGRGSVFIDPEGNFQDVEPPDDAEIEALCRRLNFGSRAARRRRTSARGRKPAYRRRRLQMIQPDRRPSSR